MLNFRDEAGILPSGVAAMAEGYGKPYPYAPHPGEDSRERATFSQRSLGKIVVSYWQGVEQNGFNFLGVRYMILHRPTASSSFPRSLFPRKREAGIQFYGSDVDPRFRGGDNSSFRIISHRSTGKVLNRTCSTFWVYAT